MNEHESVPNIRFKGFEDEWKNLKLGELSEIARGASPRPINNKKWFSKNSKIGWLRISDVTEQNGRIFYLKQKLSIQGQKKTRVIKTKHLLLSIAATVGSPVINYIPTGVHDGFLIFYNPKFDIEFMFQWLQKYRKNWSKFGQPGSQVNLNSEIVRNQKVYIPEEKEEREIANLFLKIDRLLDLQQQKIESLELLKNVLLQKLFPKHDKKIPELRFKVFNDEWTKEKLSKLGHTFSGLSGKNKRDFGHGKAKYITYMNVFKNPLTSKTGLDNIEVDSKQHTVKYGDVLFTMSSETPEEVGMSSVWKYHLENIYLNSFSFGYRHGTKFDLNFLAFMFRSQVLREQIKILAQGISRYNISKNKMMDILAYFPTEPEQQKIGNLLSKVYQLIELENKKLEDLQQFKKCLLQNMFVE